MKKIPENKHKHTRAFDSKAISETFCRWRDLCDCNHSRFWLHSFHFDREKKMSLNICFPNVRRSLFVNSREKKLQSGFELCLRSELLICVSSEISIHSNGIRIGLHLRWRLIRLDSLKNTSRETSVVFTLNVKEKHFKNNCAHRACSNSSARLLGVCVYLSPTAKHTIDGREIKNKPAIT